MTDLPDRPLCIIGDSFVAGLGDPSGLGWPGRLTAAAGRSGLALHVSVCGIRGDTSEGLLARWDEVDRRVASWPAMAVIAEFGVNDVIVQGGVERVTEAGIVAAVRGMAARAPEGRLLVVGPPPIAWDEVNRRVAARSAAIGAACASLGVPFVPTVEGLRASEVWMREVAARDGAHPGADGYEEFARVVVGPILDWLRSR